MSWKLTLFIKKRKILSNVHDFRAYDSWKNCLNMVQMEKESRPMFCVLRVNSFSRANKRYLLWEQVELLLLCWGNIEKTSLDPSDGRNAPGSDEKEDIAFLSFLNSGAAKLSAYTGRRLHRTACLHFSSHVSSQARNTYPRKLLELLPYLHWGLQYPKSAKTCRVQAGLECCISNNAQHYSFRRDILPSVTVSFLLLLMGAAKEGG